MLVALAAGLLPTSLAVVFAANPLFRRGKSPEVPSEGSDRFTPLAIGPAAVPNDGTPIRVTVVADRVDAWNVYPAQRIGTVWLRKNERAELVAYSTICPHLGCSIEYRPGDRDFHCPCHNSQFTLAGEPTNRIPPRSMDLLETKIVEDRVWVRYENFRGGLKEKVQV
jgi:menaquinol-cytochrome c reductase iron-sulfur subunit